MKLKYKAGEREKMTINRALSLAILKLESDYVDRPRRSSSKSESEQAADVLHQVKQAITDPKIKN